jgi:hypothetical protein
MITSAVIHVFRCIIFSSVSDLNKMLDDSKLRQA